MQNSTIKRIAFLTIVFLVGFFLKSPAATKINRSYAEMWKKADSLLLIQQPESALKIMDAIHQKSIVEKSQIQQMKAFVGIQQVKLETSDEVVSYPFTVWEKERMSLKPQNQAVLLAYQGDFMIQLFNRKRGEIFERTKGAAQPNDMATWDVAFFKSKIDSCFLKSLENHKLLAKISSKEYLALLDTVKLAWQYRPALLDLVAAKALEFYRNDGFDLSPIPLPWAKDAGVFTDKYIPKSTGNESFNSRVFHVFSLLEDHHEKNGETDALLHLKLERLDYIYERSLLPAKDELYLTALKSLENQIGNHPFKAEVLEKQADVLSGMANLYDPKNPVTEIYRTKIKEAADIYSIVIQKYPASFACVRCINKLRQLQAPQLQLIIENIVRKGFPFAVSVQYSNLSAVKVKIFRVNQSEYLKLLKSSRYYSLDREQKFKTEELISEDSFQLVHDGDLRNHTTEFVFPKLNSGLYLIKLESVTGKNSCSSVALFTVSGINFSGQYQQMNVIDIENGTPVKGAAIEIFERDNKSWKTERFNSSEDGNVIVKAETHLVRITFKTDTVTMLWDNHLSPCFRNDTLQQLYLFTDRSIYRPGQTVFFKGILFNKDPGKIKSLENKSVEVELHNINFQGVDSLKLVTNRYGTISGEFKIPSGGMPGDYFLYSDLGGVLFHVEEYRRSGFKIKVDDLKGEYHLNSEVEVTGNVTSYSGVPLKNVTGKFRVSHNSVWLWRSKGEPEQIADGSFKTDKDGKYIIRFVAKPDGQTIETTTYPSRFEVAIDITDITGETQSASKLLKIAKEALTASITGAAVFDLANTLKNKAIEFSYKVINSDNQEIQTKGRVELIRLKSPQTPLRKRQWENPDRPIYTPAQWDMIFPGNLFGDEMQPINYEEEKVIQTINFESADRSDTSFNASGLEQGYYKIRMTTADKFGLPVKAEHLVRVFDSSKKAFHFSENSWTNLSKTTAIPGDTVELLLGNFGKQYWMVQIYRKSGTSVLFNGIVDKTMEKIVIPIDTTDQGGVIVGVTTIYQGISFYQELRVDVPWIQKELKLSVEDFPKIIIPGKEASWKVRVVDAEGKPVKAEMAGVVYDASLDKILPHNWQLLIWDNDIHSSQFGYPSQIVWGNIQFTQPVQINEKQEILPAFRNGFDYQEYKSKRYLTGAVSVMKSTVTRDNIPPPPPAAEEDAVFMIVEDGNQNRTKVKEKPVQIRSDFRETAWFNAQFETDESGRAEVRFNLPESVTEWKFMALAHTLDGLSGTMTDKFVTQKQLMVEPFPTRFLTVGDEVTFPVKVTNLSGKSLSLEVKMELFNVETEKIIVAASKSTKLTLVDGVSDAIEWKLSAPTEPGLYRIRVVALGDGYSDGFEQIIPVEPDRTWTNEAKAFTVKPGNNYALSLNQLGSNDQLLEGKWNLTLMTNPMGLILDALPQLMSSESFTISGVASRLTGALVLRKILTDHPEINKELESQRNKLINSPDSFKTRLEKAEQFTGLKLNETPWLKESIYEKEKLAKFNPDTVKTTISDAIQRFEVAQLPDGGFAWCPGMKSSEWMTLQILDNFAQMRSKKLLSGSELVRIMAISTKSVNYLDIQVAEDYRRLKENDKTGYDPGSELFNYLYTRSAFKDLKFEAGAKEAYDFYLGKASKNWTQTGIWQQAQLAIVLKREGNGPLLQMITKSFEERAIKSDELGMYWKQSRGFYFYREPDIALQSFMIEIFNLINAPAEKTNAMKLWLLQQKRTHAWDSPYATAQAVYALLSDVNEPIAKQSLPEIYLDGKIINTEKSKTVDGFIQWAFNQNDLNKNSKIELRNAGKSVIFGGLFHGYFKQVNDTSRSGSSLKIRKEIFKLEKSVRGDSLVSTLSDCRPGDLLMVRLLIENDRNLGFISIDDQRPAGTEPLNQLSEYEYKGGLWYYRVNIDTGTRFFMDDLPKGRYILEYPVRVSHMGTFSGGRATIQCSFAPEFGANHAPGKISFETK